MQREEGTSCSASRTAPSTRSERAPQAAEALPFFLFFFWLYLAALVGKWAGWSDKGIWISVLMAVVLLVGFPVGKALQGISRIFRVKGPLSKD